MYKPDLINNLELDSEIYLINHRYNSSVLNLILMILIIIIVGSLCIFIQKRYKLYSKKKK